MKSFAYRTTEIAVKTLSSFAKAKVRIHGTENIPGGAMIFVINHFTRLETILIPYHLYQLTHIPLWSLASETLFVGPMGEVLKSLGAVSVKNPDRDQLIIRTLLTGEAAWIIFPEGRMVKNKKIIEKGRFMISYAGGSHPPHTGAATLALRAEFIRQRIAHLARNDFSEAERFSGMFGIDNVSDISQGDTSIIPVNITYYPVRTQENILSRLAQRLVGEISERLIEEIMTEGSMLLSGVDIDIRMGAPIPVGLFLKERRIASEISRSTVCSNHDPFLCSPKMNKPSLNIMQQYMGAIYEMTTINHDHIFASLLKKSPVDRINLKDFKARAYLAITGKSHGVNAFYHDKLMKDQLHLLVDDRHLIFEEFLKLAEETEAVVRENQFLKRDRHKLFHIFDFHRARIDNPVAVIANEVEPLSHLQKQLSRLSWKFGFLIRKKIVKILMSKANNAFDADYDTFYSTDDSKPKSIGRPFLIKGRSKKIGILLIHGYMAAPEEVRNLAEFFGEKGFWVYAPRLKGHGTTPEDLATRRWQDWVRSVDEGYAIMSYLCDQVVVGGFSTGAALALELSSRVQNVKGVFAVSTPLRLQYLRSRFAPAVNIWNRLMDRINFDDAKKEFVANDPENPDINYHRNPVSGVSELENLMSHLEPRLKKVISPALIVQSQRDPVVDPKGSEEIFQLLGTENKTYVLFNMDRHGIIRGEDALRVYQTIFNFLKHLKSNKR